MSTNLPRPSDGPHSVRLFGVGDTGISAIELLIGDGLPSEQFVAINMGGAALEKSRARQQVRLESKRLRGLGSGGDPERARQAAEEMKDELKALCEGVDVVFILAGLGGGSGTGIAPVLARMAKSTGALVLAFVTILFDCEGNRRQSLSEEGMEELRNAVDGIICLRNQRIFDLIQENTSLVDTFKIANRLLGDGVHGVWRLVSFKGLIEIHLDELCRLLRDRHSESTFAVAVSEGVERAARVTDRLLSHPLLDEGELLPKSETVLVSLMGGPDLTMAEVDQVMAQIRAKCESIPVMMGACIDESFGGRLAVTIIASSPIERDESPARRVEELHAQLLDRGATAKPNSRFLPPPPELPPEQVQQLLAKQRNGRARPGKISAKMRQTQLPLEIVSKGRFDKSEPTIYKGEDLDVPTYIRRGVPLN